MFLWIARYKRKHRTIINLLNDVADYQEEFVPSINASLESAGSRTNKCNHTTDTTDGGKTRFPGREGKSVISSPGKVVVKLAADSILVFLATVLSLCLYPQPTTDFSPSFPSPDSQPVHRNCCSRARQRSRWSSKPTPRRRRRRWWRGSRTTARRTPSPSGTSFPLRSASSSSTTSRSFSPVCSVAPVSAIPGGESGDWRLYERTELLFSDRIDRRFDRSSSEYAARGSLIVKFAFICALFFSFSEFGSSQSGSDHPTFAQISRSALFLSLSVESGVMLRLVADWFGRTFRFAGGGNGACSWKWRVHCWREDHGRKRAVVEDGTEGDLGWEIGGVASLRWSGTVLYHCCWCRTLPFCVCTCLVIGESRFTGLALFPFPSWAWFIHMWALCFALWIKKQKGIIIVYSMRADKKR